MTEHASIPWSTIRVATEGTGLTVNALREYIKKGLLTEKHHWVKAPNGRIMVHRERFARWLEGTEE